MTLHRHPDSPILDHCPETLPARAYSDAEWYRREQATVWARNWVYAARLNDIAPGTMRRVQVGAASVMLCRTPEGDLSAFHNLCRHRGAELCTQAVEQMGRLVSCRYHAWSYAARDGRLVATGHARPTDDFHKEDHGLLPVSIRVWNGFVFVNLARDPGAIEPDMGLRALDNWPMDSLVTGHRLVVDLACNWKIFWENYNECLHCPGVHPELCDMVPIYGAGIMGWNEAPDWTPDDASQAMLKDGAKTWTGSGKTCGPEFANLTPMERQNGFTFVTVYPTMYIVAHVDYVRSVKVEATGPETTRLSVEWYFPQATLDQPGFDAAEVAEFAKIVMAQDGEVAELNQRGIRSPAYVKGRLMPEEYAIHDFHKWLLRNMGEEAAA